MKNKERILENLRKQVNENNNLLGVAVGSGLTAKYAEEGGADFLLVLNSGKFRQLGRSSLAGFMPYENSNGLVMNFGSREIMPLIKKIPLIFGLNSSDPLINLETYIEYIKDLGFDGINNYPSIGMIDGKFREALEEEGISYKSDIEAIRIAHNKGMVTVAFVFNAEQSREMAEVGADVIVSHLGFTSGGILGAKKILSLQNAKLEVDAMFEACDSVKKGIFKMIYGGPVKTPIDLQYMYKNTSAMGYIGGSAIERIPMEKSILELTRSFKNTGSINEDQLMVKMLDGIKNHYNYVEFVMRYITENYKDSISLDDLAQVAHISVNHLSTLFRKEVGIGFKQYLVQFRISKAVEIIKNTNISLFEVAELVGYKDYAQFSKMFKKIVGKPPKALTYIK